MKRIYIYLPDDGKEYTSGARVELSEKPNGEIYAFVSSPRIDELWEHFQRRIARHGLKADWANIFKADLTLALYDNEQVPFRCLRRLNDTQWACTERCIVGAETAQEFMR